MIYEEDRQALSDAYHEGYQQGQFDEYASRMGNKQAEKMKARMEQQKNCPYCHEPFEEWFNTGDPYVKCEFKDGTQDYHVTNQIQGCNHHWGIKHEVERYDGSVSTWSRIFYCPVCGRLLQEDGK